jgi:TDG/mug DNA glycosylase family protein
MGELFGVEWSQDYTQRIIQFRQLPLVLWDVLQSCHRSGSLDGNIENQNLVPNDIGRVLNLYPAINTLVFNGAAAHQLFRRHVISQLDSADGLRLLRLPSTSPAHAAVNRQQKLQHWAVIRTILQSSEPACGADIS